MPYHTLTWLAWLGAAAYLALVNQQPLQSALLILAVGTVFAMARRRNLLGQGWSAFLRLGLWVWLVALAFNLLSTHAGRIVLFALPRGWPLIGGPITLEALLYGLATGASLFTTLLVFATFNLAADQHRLLRWVPAALFQAGLVVSIALAFVPQMMASLADIREAQRIRGHKFRGLRDLIPLFVPLITTALERALALAESIEARGFGAVTTHGSVQRRRWLNASMLAGLGSLLAALVCQTVRPRVSGAAPALFLVGALCVLLTLYLQGQMVQRTHYRREVWRQRDTAAIAACAVSVTIVSFVRAQNLLALWYYPYPPFAPWPVFTPLIGLAAALLAAPAFLWPGDEPALAACMDHRTRSVPRGTR